MCLNHYSICMCFGNHNHVVLITIPFIFSSLTSSSQTDNAVYSTYSIISSEKLMTDLQNKAWSAPAIFSVKWIEGDKFVVLVGRRPEHSWGSQPQCFAADREQRAKEHIPAAFSSFFSPFWRLFSFTNEDKGPCSSSAAEFLLLSWNYHYYKHECNCFTKKNVVHRYTATLYISRTSLIKCSSTFQNDLY